MSNKNFDIVPISIVQRQHDIDGFPSISKQYRVYKDSLFGASSTLYPISTTISYTIYDFLVPKQEQVFHINPAPPSIDSNEDREMDSNNHNDDMDQDISAWQFSTAQSGPFAQFLNDMPDWMNMTPEDINLAVVNPSEAHILPGILLQEAIEANEWHHIHDRHYQSIT
jgi:hypothetical protein